MTQGSRSLVLLVAILWWGMGKGLCFGRRDGLGTELSFFPFLVYILSQSHDFPIARKSVNSFSS